MQLKRAQGEREWWDISKQIIRKFHRTGKSGFVDNSRVGPRLRGLQFRWFTGPRNRINPPSFASLSTYDLTVDFELCIKSGVYIYIRVRMHSTSGAHVLPHPFASRTPRWWRGIELFYASRKATTILIFRTSEDLSDHMLGKLTFEFNRPYKLWARFSTQQASTAVYYRFYICSSPVHPITGPFLNTPVHLNLHSRADGFNRGSFFIFWLIIANGRIRNIIEVESGVSERPLGVWLWCI
jgi:hypothetical protein